MKVPQQGTASPRKKEKAQSPVSDAREISYPPVDMQAWLAEELSFSAWRKSLENLDKRAIARKYLNRYVTLIIFLKIPRY